jgi:hypothetical protein
LKKKKREMWQLIAADTSLLHSSHYFWQYDMVAIIANDKTEYVV